MQALEAFGAAAVSLMVLCYAFERRSPGFVLGFAGACLLSSAYAAAIGSWPFAAVELVWAALATRRWHTITREESPMTSATIDSVCSLEGDSREDRLAMIRRELLPRVLRTRELGDSVIWEFERTPELHARLEEFVAFESRCCSSLRWSLRETASELHLHVGGVDPDAFRAAVTGAGSSGTGSVVRRLLEASGLGLAAALVVCCALPLGLSLAFGAAIAAPFALLDDPVAIAAAALGLSGLAWVVLRRRRRRSTEAPCCDTC